jgi:PGF-pre-PGF domain-containing protein
MLKRGKLAVLLALVLVFSIFLVSTSLSDSAKPKISSSVMSELENKEKVRVIITLKGGMSRGKLSASSINARQQVIDYIGKENVGHEFSSSNSFSAEITKDKLVALELDENIGEISYDAPIKAFLQESTVIINATRAWTVQISNTNLTGQGQTVCVIDSGINSSHPDLAGKVLGGWNYVGNNNNTLDDYGHGTHVAGIIAANGGIKGVAPGANLIAIKALDFNGEGYSTDAISGIEWCVNNASVYNISVISMSLGGLTLYTSYCDDSQTSFASAINAAIAKNISVVVATGNDGNYTAIASPACIQNATSVGATNKSDTIANYSNRNNITDLVAPGTNINSTYLAGYANLSGTSMAAPHVAAAIAILQQAKKLRSNQYYTPAEVLSILQSKGKQINDTAGQGLNFSRINIYDAIELNAPLYYNVSNTTYYGSFFNITWIDETAVSVVKAEFNGTNYTGNNISQTGNIYILNRTFAAGNYTLRWHANDTFGNANATDLMNISILKADSLLNLSFNISGAIYHQNIIVENNTAINISLSSRALAENDTYILYQNNTLINNKTKLLSNVSTYYIGTYNITAYHSESQNFSENSTTFSITVQSPGTAPESSKISPSNSSYLSNANVTFRINVSDSALSNVTLYIWNSTNVSLIIASNSTNITGMYNQTNWSQELNDTSYFWNIVACDTSGKCNSSENNYTLIVDTIKPVTYLTISDADVTDAEDVTVTCNATDSNLDNVAIYIDNDRKATNYTNSTSILVSYKSSFGAGTKIVNCSAYDKASNYNQTNSTITVTSSGGDDGGSSGSDSSSDTSSSGETATVSGSYSISYDKISADQTIDLELPSSAQDATAVSEITLMPTIDAVNVDFKVAPVNESDAESIDSSLAAYRYFSITIENLDDSYIDNAEINFEVDKDWFTENNYSVNTTKLLRYHNEDWQRIDPNMTGETSSKYEFMAETPGFSVFAITAKKGASANLSSQLNNTVVSGETQANSKFRISGTVQIIGAAVAGLAILITAVIIIINAMKPKGHDRFHPEA